VWAIACVLVLGVVPGVRAGDKYFDANGVKIRYTDEGRGEPVVLIHGFGANIEVQWALPGLIKALAKDNRPLDKDKRAPAKDYRVIAFDVRGHGKSGKPHDPKKYGAEMAEDVVRLLDHLKIKKAHVVGYSMGAIITARLLVAHPDRLLTATLGGAGAARQGDKEMMRFVEGLADSLEKGKGIGPLIEALTPEGKPKPSAEQIEAINKFFTARNDVKALAAVGRGWPGLAVSDKELQANRVPVLALIGKNDPLKKGVDAMQGRLAGLKAVVVPGDHLTAFVQPEFLQALRAFLDEHRAGGKGK
jgi:pimeloyl-ACP methyl ester carboxylesterase